ncbi:hypothetical protein [Photobacterium sp. 1_MG-2023]|nr:hypothetical protein [Photobacterium sp. 1_MG-2023]MDO6708299.1 hypothetical protein [Photobacterium sp. 1_MG-2023]
MAVQKEITDVIALEQTAKFYKDKKGRCPSSVSALVGIAIKREPEDRVGL